VSTFGTRMAGSGVSLRTLQEWMGHRSSKTTEIVLLPEAGVRFPAPQLGEIPSQVLDSPRLRRLG
jgi:integrase